ncbi:MAG: pyridoxamine 5'-phosphate oxidase family protein [Filimonas sp.]|nr:pyridoxamine 5'-phosphate oxidase family protein [Filimonas sp.]
MKKNIASSWQEENVAKFAACVKRVRVCMLTKANAFGEVISRPMYTAGIDKNGDLYFFLPEDAEETDGVNWINEVHVLYSNQRERRHLQVKGQTVLVIDRAQKREMWNNLLEAYYPNGHYKMKLLKMHVSEVCSWHDFHTKKEMLIQRYPSPAPALLQTAIKQDFQKLALPRAV